MDYFFNHKICKNDGGNKMSGKNKRKKSQAKPRKTSIHRAQQGKKKAKSTWSQILEAFYKLSTTKASYDLHLSLFERWLDNVKKHSGGTKLKENILANLTNKSAKDAALIVRQIADEFRPHQGFEAQDEFAERNNLFKEVKK